ncbi:MAG: hypothetical protein KAH18_04935 [Psychromonas sp.]|nr:hypothetical protein [Psychromonas sp.]
MKIKNFAKITTLFLISLMLVACSAKSNTALSEPTPATVLEGTWTYDCADDPDSDGSLQISKTYADNNVVVSTTSYFRPDCEAPIMNTKITSNFTIGEIVNKGSKDEYTKIDRTSDKAVVTILDQSTINEANYGAGGLGDFGFDITDWGLNQPRDVTNNKLAIKYYHLGNTYHNIFKIDSNKLFGGDQGGPKDADGRPTVLDMKVWGIR